MQLFQVARFADKREAVEIILAVLRIHQVKVYAFSVDAYRGTCLHASGRNAVAGDGFSQVIRCRFRTASSCQHLVSDVHQPVQESTGSQHHTFGMKRHSPASHQAGHFSVLHQQLFHRILPDMQVGQVLQNFSPGPDKFPAVALGTRTPHGRSLGTVQHTELDGGLVCHQPHVSSQGVNLSDDLSLGNTPYGRVTTHLPDFVHVHCNQAGL